MDNQKPMTNLTTKQKKERMKKQFECECLCHKGKFQHAEGSVGCCRDCNKKRIGKYLCDLCFHSYKTKKEIVECLSNHMDEAEGNIEYVMNYLEELGIKSL